MARTLINIPRSARRGEVIEIKALIAHVMETGFRPTPGGGTVPRDIITTFVAKYGGEEIFRMSLFPAASANPLITFHTIATATGEIELVWTGDNGFHAIERAKIVVT